MECHSEKGFNRCPLMHDWSASGHSVWALGQVGAALSGIGDRLDYLHHGVLLSVRTNGKCCCKEVQVDLGLYCCILSRDRTVHVERHSEPFCAGSGTLGRCMTVQISWLHTLTCL